MIVVELTTLNDVAGTPPNFTEDVPVKFTPVIVTVAPIPAVVGLKDRTVGSLFLFL